jgi:hypothetical protein
MRLQLWLHSKGRKQSTSRDATLYRHLKGKRKILNHFCLDAAVSNKKLATAFVFATMAGLLA